VQVLVRDNNVDQALKALKKKMQREGIFREMKLRGHYEKPSEKRARERLRRCVARVSSLARNCSAKVFFRSRLSRPSARRAKGTTSAACLWSGAFIFYYGREPPSSWPSSF
jgi:small subunit ribosomal protein S21